MFFLAAILNGIQRRTYPASRLAPIHHPIWRIGLSQFPHRDLGRGKILEHSANVGFFLVVSNSPALAIQRLTDRGRGSATLSFGIAKSTISSVVDQACRFEHFRTVFVFVESL